MKRTTITMDGYGRVAVPSDAANVWMSEMELVTLFDIIAPSLRAAIRAVYKSGVVQPCEAERRIRLSNGYYTDVCEKKGKSCGSLWIAVTDTGVRLITANLTIVFC